MLRPARGNIQQEAKKRGRRKNFGHWGSRPFIMLGSWVLDRTPSQPPNPKAGPNPKPYNPPQVLFVADMKRRSCFQWNCSKTLPIVSRISTRTQLPTMNPLLAVRGHISCQVNYSSVHLNMANMMCTLKQSKDFKVLPLASHFVWNCITGSVQIFVLYQPISNIHTRLMWKTPTKQLSR